MQCGLLPRIPGHRQTRLVNLKEREVLEVLLLLLIAQSCLTLCTPLDSSTPGLPVLHHLPEFAQAHVHQVGDAIQPSRPLLSPSPPAFDLFQHQSFPVN